MPVVTVYRAHGLRGVIFVDDHEPAHVHVFGDGHAKIDLADPQGMPELVRVEGMNRVEMRRAMRIVMDRQAMLLDRWRVIHGGHD